MNERFFSNGFLFIGGPLDGQRRRRFDGPTVTVPVKPDQSGAARTVTYVPTREARSKQESLWIMQPVGENLGPDYNAWPERVRELCADILGVTP